MSKGFKLTIIFFLMLSSAVYLYAGGLSSYFVEAKLEKLLPGVTYSVKEMTSKSLIIVNTTEGMVVDIAVEPERPVSYNLVKGYEPIPDISWVKIAKNYFTAVGPQESIETDITITIPRDKKYYGRKYQVYIYSHTAGEGTFRIGLMSRILFTVGRPLSR